MRLKICISLLITSVAMAMYYENAIAQINNSNEDTDPEYFVPTSKNSQMFTQFVLLPRGGWPDPKDNDPSYEILRFGALRVINIEAKEGLIEGDILVGSEAELIAHEALVAELGSIIRVDRGENGSSAILREVQRTLSRPDMTIELATAHILQKANQTINIRAQNDRDLAQQSIEILKKMLADRLNFKGPGILSNTVSTGKKWPNPFDKNTPILWTFGNLPGNRHQWVTKGMEPWINIGIKFTFVKELKAGQNGISFENGSGCSSYIGMKGGTQAIRLGTGCEKAVAHEIGHALGLFHEQSHPERDQFVTIHWGNIKQGAEHNFAIKQNPGKSTVYDYKSIMHYKRNAFSRNGLPTITPKNQKIQIGQRDGLSPLDIQGIELLYDKRKQACEENC